MIKNYLKIAIRNLQKNRLYSFINILGLAVGIACCLLISLFIWQELSYDRHYTDGDRIYRITSEIKFNDNHFTLATGPAPLMEATVKEFAEVESGTRFRNRGSYLIKTGEENFKENDVIFADSSVFDVFAIPFINGDPNTALQEPNSLVLSKSFAEKLFGRTDVINETVILDNRDSYIVKGVYEDIPVNSHFHFNVMISMTGLEEAKSPMWLSNNFNTYVKLREGVSAEEFKTKLDLLVEKYIAPQLQHFVGHSLDEFNASGNKIIYDLQPLYDIHLHSDLTAELEANSDITYVYLFAAIALFILLIACINFMNLSTARSASRAKEVGIRKVLGSFKSYLVNQFLAESILLSAVAFFIGLGIAQLVIPYFNDLAGKSLTLPYDSVAFWGLILLSILIIGSLAGTYPAFFLSSFKPAQVLKSNKSNAGNSAFIRSTLVTFQFGISIVLIIGTIAVYNQLNYIQKKNLGFNREQVIIIKDAYGLGTNFEAFKNEVVRHPDIKVGTATAFLPAGGTSRTDMTFWKEGVEASEDNMVSTQIWNVDHNYIPTLQMELTEGRNFSPEFTSDSSAVIINEAAAKAYGFDNNPTEGSIQTFAYDYEAGQMIKDKFETFKVIGVVKNFHFQSLKTEVKPLALRLYPSRSLMAFRFDAENTNDVIDHIQLQWQNLATGQPFLYSFMDDDFEDIYQSEMRLGKLFSVFSGLAIFIACLGLFALSSFTAERRIKEIGVRKVLGASVSSIVLLFTKDFSRLVLIAFVIAVPLAWYAVDSWLTNYSYKTDIGIWVYAVAGLVTLIIAIMTMSFQSIRAAVTNPVDSLKHE